MANRTLDIKTTTWPLKEPFAISRDTVTAIETVQVSITQDGARGRGECRPYARYDETQASVIEEIEEARAMVERGGTRKDLLAVLHAGAARNAVDCALWDLEAKLTGKPVWELAGLEKPKPVEVTYTLSLDTPEKMAAAARRADRPLLKLKLGGRGDLERVQAVREAAPQSRLIVDANEAWTSHMVRQWLEPMAALGVELVEQPLHADHDGALRGMAKGAPLCADESCHTASDLDRLKPLYRMVNVKLDKTGGLTEALRLIERAEELGFGIMVGCMMASSLAMAPAFLLASRARFVDLDAPLLLASDESPAMAFEGAMMQPPEPELWG